MKITEFFKSNHILKALFIAVLYQVQPVWAATCTTAPECIQTGTSGFIGNFDSVIIPSSANPANFDTTRFTSTSGFELWVADDIRGVTLTDSPYGLVEKMFFAGDSNNPQRMDVTFFSSILTADRQIKDTGEARSLETSQLNLNYVNFETTPSLKFFGTDNQINLIDSRVKFNSQPQIISNAPFTINVNDALGAGKESSFLNFFGFFKPTSTTINIENGNTLIFEDSGSVFASTNAARLYFASPVIGNVNNGTLGIDSSNVYFNSTSFDFTNGSTLNTVGSDSSVEFRDVSFDNSLMTLGNNTTVTATDLNLDSAYISLGSGAKVNASILTVKGDGSTTILSGGRNNASINVEGFIIESGATFEQQDSSRVNGGRDLFLRPGATLSINTDSVFIVSTITGLPDPAQTSTVDVNTGGTFFLGNGLSGIGRNIAFDVDGTSFLRVGSNGLLELGYAVNKNASGGLSALTNLGEISVQNDGQIDIDGKFSGNGTIAGSGKFLINNSGQIAPGPVAYFKTDTITFENAVEFTNFGTSRNRSRYLADVDVVGGIPRNDLLQYDDQSFDITNLESIEVNTASGKTADDLNGQVFTIISSVDAGSTGTLVTGGSYPTIVAGGDVPALIDFTVVNNSTNGKDDLTLQADKDLDHLTRHPSVTRNSRGSATQNNRGSGAALLVNSANSGNSATISALNTLTNSQVASHVDSIHAEPYSSYMTVSVEHSDSVMNTVMSYAAPNGGFSTGATQEVKEQQTGKRSWMDVSYAEGKVDGSDDLGDFDYELSSLTIGQDLMGSGDRALGAYFSFGTQKMDEHDKANQDFSSDTYHLGLYLNQANIGAWDLRGVLGYAFSDHESKRQVSLSSSSTIAEADFNSHSAYVGVKGTITGYENDWVTLSPELGLSYIYYSQESIKEAGDPNLSLNIDSADTHAIVASAGLNARFVSLSDTMSIYPLAFSRYEHDFYANDNNEHEIDAALVAHPDFKQPFVGQNRGEHAIISGIGLGSDLTSALQINGGFDYSVSNHGSEWGAGFNLEYYW